MLIGLVRHGAHDELGRVLSGRASDVALNAAGRAQATALAARFAARGIARIETSPRRRTVETAAILGQALGLAPVVEDALDEVDFGAWAGRPFAELDPDPAWQHWNAARGSAPSAGGETMPAAVERARRHLHRLAAAGGEGPILCVSHCDIIRGVLADCLGLPLDNLLRFDADPASVSWMRVNGQGCGHVLTVNGDC